MTFSTNPSRYSRTASSGHAISMEQMLAPLVSVIVPTYREAENLPVLIPAVSQALEQSGMSAEILIVDDNSPDNTVAVCQELSQHYPVRLLVRTVDRGLSSAVVHGLNHARGSVLLVMDADLSHPPAKVPELVAAVLEQQGDFVIGSRYVAGGTTDDNWSLFRWVNSQVATWLSRGLTSARDPMAGFFALSRQTYEQAQQLNPIGYKIGLELMVKCHCQRVAEVPIHFQDRLHGESKLSLKEQLNYLRHLGRLYRYKLGKWFTPLLFGLVGASGVLVDLLLFSLMLTLTTFPVARAFAIWGAMSWNYLGNRNLTFADRQSEPMLFQYLKFCGSCLLGATLSWGISTLLWQNFAVQIGSPQVAALAGILGGVTLNYLFSSTFVFRKQEPDLAAFISDTEPAVSAKPVSKSSGKNSVDLAAAKQGKSQALPGKRGRIAGGIFLTLVVLALTSFTWFRQQIDGLDQAHNVLTSIYFYDVFRDLPTDRFMGYTLDYQKQYPALGLMFWPPLFHAVAGLAMQVTGPSLQTIHIVLACFTLLFALTFYGRASSGLTVIGAVAAVVLTLTTPVMFQLENTVMLEVPSMATAFLSLWIYGRVVDRGRWLNWREAVLGGVCCALIAYTKQPAIFVLLGVLLDVLVNHRALLQQKLTWLCVSTAAVSLVPLAAFTLKFGKVNIAQSIGNQGNIYVEHHRVADRWSLEGWTYYLQLLPEQLPWVVLLLSTLGFGLMVFNRNFQKTHGIWFWGFAAWFLMFSYFDNKQVRFAVYAIPFLSVAAVVAAEWLCVKRRLAGLAAVGILVGATAWNIPALARQAPRGYDQMQPLLSLCLEQPKPGNFTYFGEDHHLFTAELRLQDSHRERYLLRGDDLLEQQAEQQTQGLDAPLTKLLSDYQIRWLLLDPELPAGQTALAAVQANPELFRLVQEKVKFDNGLKPFLVSLYEYRGPLAESMRPLTLKSQLLGIAEE